MTAKLQQIDIQPALKIKRAVTVARAIDVVGFFGLSAALSNPPAQFGEPLSDLFLLVLVGLFLAIVGLILRRPLRILAIAEIGIAAMIISVLIVLGAKCVAIFCLTIQLGAETAGAMCLLLIAIYGIWRFTYPKTPDPVEQEDRYTEIFSAPAKAGTPRTLRSGWLALGQVVGCVVLFGFGFSVLEESSCHASAGNGESVPPLR
jgi:hypothetical protein